VFEIIKPSFEFINPISYEQALNQVELAARTAYKSEDKITTGSAEKIVKHLIKNGHESCLEHVSFGIRIICSRASSHQLVRHRTGMAITQESMRWCNYNKKGLFQFILTKNIDKNEQARMLMFEHFNECVERYNKLIGLGLTPEDARCALPISTKTELVITPNLRELRHIFKVRTAPDAQQEIRDVFIDILNYMKYKYPIFVSEFK
jgi:thymidylate synthase (FAD)